MSYAIWEKPRPERPWAVFSNEPVRVFDAEEEAKRVCDEMNRAKPSGHPGYFVQKLSGDWLSLD